MSSIPFNNPFQLQKHYSRPNVPKNTSIGAKQAPSAPTFSNSSRAFGAVKMARFMAEDSYTDSFESRTFGGSVILGANASMDMMPNRATRYQVDAPTALRDSSAGLLQSLSSPARKRDAAPLASEDWLPNAPVYDDLSDQPAFVQDQYNPWSQVREKLMDIFFEPLPETSVRAQEVQTSYPPVMQRREQKERPIGIAQLTRVTFSSASASSASVRSPLERLKSQSV